MSTILGASTALVLVFYTLVVFGVTYLASWSAPMGGKVFHLGLGCDLIIGLYAFAHLAVTAVSDLQLGLLGVLMIVRLIAFTLRLYITWRDVILKPDTFNSLYGYDGFVRLGLIASTIAGLNSPSIFATLLQAGGLLAIVVLIMGTHLVQKHRLLQTEPK